METKISKKYIERTFPGGHKVVVGIWKWGPLFEKQAKETQQSTAQKINHKQTA
jgi:hypothetical protein